MPRRLATQLILVLAGILLAAKVISLLIDLRTEERRLIEGITVGADQLSRSIAGATWQAMLADRRADAYQVMNTIAAKQGIERIRMFNKDGILMFSTVGNEQVHVDERNEVCAPCHADRQPAVQADLTSRSRVSRDGGRRTLSMITPIYNERSCSQAACHAHAPDLRVLGVLDLTLDASRVDDEMRAIRARTAVLGIVEIAVIGLFLVFFIRRFVEKPIQELVDATTEIAEMRLERPIVIRSSEELEQLAASFNVMRERLGEAVAENAEFTRTLEQRVEERTEQLRLAERKLMHSDRLASLGQLAASVAHEINNPVAGVLNLSMLMQRILKDDGIPPGRIAEFRRYLGHVAAETSRVGRIVSDLLSFSRRSAPQSAESDLNAIVRTTVSLIAHKLQLNNVELVLDLQESLPHLRCDASQMQQVVMNLVLNAGEAIHGGGKVTIRTVAEDAFLVMEVTDDGSGMTPEVIRKIFDPFFTTKEEGKGVGLGLAVVYGIVNAHHGDIDVTSCVGKGTTFRVTLPLVWKAEPAEPTLAAAV